MPARRLIAATALVLAAALASPAAGAAQGGSGPGELWRAFPLDPVTTAPAAPAEPPAASPAPSGGDQDLVPILAIVVAVLGMAALVAVAAGRRARGARTRLPPAVAPPAGAPPAVAPPAPPPPRRDALDLARLSAEYLEVVGSGSRRPVVEVADRHGWDVERTRRALGRARARGLLLGAGRGRAGGALSGEAERLLAASAAAVAAPHHQPQARPGGVDRADLVVDEPGRQADLADDVLGEVGGDPGGALGPRHPEAAVGANGRVGAR